MSDQNKFVNTYIETAIGTIHEYVASAIQLKTQLKLTQELIAEKDNQLKQLSEQLNTATLTQSEKNVQIDDLVKERDQERARNVEYQAMKAKVQHMDTLLNQITEMKRQIAELTAELDQYKNPPKKVKKPKVAESEPVKVVDDF